MSHSKTGVAVDAVAAVDADVVGAVDDVAAGSLGAAVDTDDVADADTVDVVAVVEFVVGSVWRTGAPCG